jgi:hypothetical protein
VNGNAYCQPPGNLAQLTIGITHVSKTSQLFRGLTVQNSWTDLSLSLQAINQPDGSTLAVTWNVLNIFSAGSGSETTPVPDSSLTSLSDNDYANAIANYLGIVQTTSSSV